MFVPKYEILFYQTNSQFIKRDISPRTKCLLGYQLPKFHISKHLVMEVQKIMLHNCLDIID